MKLRHTTNVSHIKPKEIKLLSIGVITFSTFNSEMSKTSRMMKKTHWLMYDYKACVYLKPYMWHVWVYIWFVTLGKLVVSMIVCFNGRISNIIKPQWYWLRTVSLYCVLCTHMNKEITNSLMWSNAAMCSRYKWKLLYYFHYQHKSCTITSVQHLLLQTNTFHLFF